MLPATECALRTRAYIDGYNLYYGCLKHTAHKWLDLHALIERILSRGLVDVGRALNPDRDDIFTWWPPWRNMRQRNIGWRIDYIFASASLAARATACPVLADVGTSDHAPVMATFS